jgi:hypothetical protein
VKFSLPLKENHKALWNWLADNPWNEKQKRLNEKGDWPGYKTIMRRGLHRTLPYPIHFKGNLCFACQATPIDGYCFACANCPVNFGAAKCTSDDSFYDRWLFSQTKAERAKYARLIARGWKS